MPNGGDKKNARQLYEGLSSNNPQLKEVGFDKFYEDIQNDDNLQQIYQGLISNNPNLKESGYDQFKLGLVTPSVEVPEVKKKEISGDLQKDLSAISKFEEAHPIEIEKLSVEEFQKQGEERLAAQAIESIQLPAEQQPGAPTEADLLLQAKQVPALKAGIEAEEAAATEIEEKAKKEESETKSLSETFKFAKDYRGAVEEAHEMGFSNLKDYAKELRGTAANEFLHLDADKKEFEVREQIANLQELKNEGADVSDDEIKKLEEQASSIKREKFSDISGEISLLRGLLGKGYREVQTGGKIPRTDRIDLTDDDKEEIRDEIEFYEGMKADVFEKDPAKIAERSKAQIEKSEVNKAVLSRVSETMPEGLSGKEQFDIYFNVLHKEYRDLAKKAGYDLDEEGEIEDEGFWPRMGLGIRSITGIMSDEEKRLIELNGALRQLSPVYLLNQSPIKEKEGFWDVFWNNLGGGLGGVAAEAQVPREQQKAQTLQQTFGAIGIKPEQLTEGVEGTLEKVGKDYDYDDWDDSKKSLAMLTSNIADIGIKYAIGGGVTSQILKGTKLGKALNTLSQEGKIEGTTSKFYQTLGKKPGLTKYIARGFQEGLKFEMSGQIFRNDQEELNFMSGFLGSSVGQLVQGASKPMLNKIYGMFGKDTPKVVNTIEGYVSRGLGELGEESMQELYQIYKATDNGKEFSEEIEKRFGKTSDKLEFILSSILMGGVFHGTNTSHVNDFYNNEATSEEKAIINEVTKEMTEEIVQSSNEAIELTADKATGEERVKEIESRLSQDINALAKEGEGDLAPEERQALQDELRDLKKVPEGEPVYKEEVTPIEEVTEPEEITEEPLVKPEIEEAVREEKAEVPKITPKKKGTPGDIDVDHVKLEGRPTEVQGVFKDVFSAIEKDPANISLLYNIDLSAKHHLTRYEIRKAVTDIQAGKESVRASKLMNAIHDASQKGVVPRYEGSGTMQQRFEISFDDFIENIKQQQEISNINKTDLPSDLMDVIEDETVLPFGEGIDTLIDRVQRGIDGQETGLNTSIEGQPILTQAQQQNFLTLLNGIKNGTIEVNTTEDGQFLSIERIDESGNRSTIYGEEAAREVEPEPTKKPTEGKVEEKPKVSKVDKAIDKETERSTKQIDDESAALKQKKVRSDISIEKARKTKVKTNEAIGEAKKGLIGFKNPNLVKVDGENVGKSIKKAYDKKEINREEFEDLKGKWNQVVRDYKAVKEGRIEDIMDPEVRNVYEQRLLKEEKASEAYISSMVRQLQKAFPNVEVVTDPAAIDQAKKDRKELFKGEGDLPPGGFTHRGVVYVDPRKATMDTPVHEFGHLFTIILKQQVPSMYKKGVDLVKNTTLLKEVQDTYPELSKEEQYEEAIVQAIGEKGANIFEPVQKKKFLRWLKEMWNRIRSLLKMKRRVNLEDMTLQQFTEIIASDLLGGIKVSELGTTAFDNATKLKNRIKYSKSVLSDLVFDDKRVKMRGKLYERYSDIGQAELDSLIFRTELKKALDKDERTAMTFYTEGTSIPLDVKASKKARQLAKDPSPEMKEWKPKIRKYLDQAHTEMMGFYGEDVGFIEDYVPHLWDIPKNREAEVVTWFLTTNKHTNKRAIKTISQGVDELGLKPKTIDIERIVGYYDQTRIHAAANQKFVEGISDFTDYDGTKLVQPSHKAPTNFVRIDHPSLRKTVMIGGEKISKDAVTLLKTIGDKTAEKMKDVDLNTMGDIEKTSYKDLAEKLDISEERAAEIKRLTSEALADNPGLKELENYPLEILRFAQVEVKVHPDIAKEVKSVLEGGIDVPAVINAVLKINAMLKKTQLTFSFFHHIALTEAAVAIGIPPLKIASLWNPVRAFKEIRSGNYHWVRNLDSSKDFIKHGGQFGALIDVHREGINEFLENLVEKNRAFLPAHYAAKGFKAFNEAMDKGLWDYMHNSYKLLAYETLVEHHLKDAKGKDAETIKKEAAQFVNDTFGGQVWELLGKSKKWQQWAQMILLSPDWTVSTMRQALSVVGIGAVEGKKMLRHKMGRAFWMRAAIYFYGGVNILNYALTKGKYDKGRFMWENDPGNKTYLEICSNPDGTKKYLRWGKQFRELPEVVEHPWDKAVSKMSPWIQLTWKQSGYTPTGFPTPWAEADGWEGAQLRIEDALRTPLPFSLQEQVRKGEFEPLSFAMPVSKGLTFWKAKIFMKKELKDADIPAIEEVYQKARENKLDAKEILDISIRELLQEVSGKIRKEHGVPSIKDLPEDSEARVMYDEYKEKLQEFQEEVEAFGEQFDDIE